MPEIPFIGPSYVSRYAKVDVERCINMYPEIAEVPNEKSKCVLISRPGKTLMGTIGLAPFRGVWVIRGYNGGGDRLFAVCFNALYEVFSNGTYTSYGNLYTDAGYVGISSNATQLIIVDGQYGYTLNLATNVLSVINQAGFIGGVQVIYDDNYFIANKPNSNTFAISNLSDGTLWNGLNTAQKEGSEDNIVAMVEWHRELFLFGQSNTEVWYNSGNNNFPFQPIIGIFIEMGCAAPFSVIKLDTTVLWVAQDENGALVVMKFEQYNPQRISTHAIEYQLSQFGDPSQIIAYGYQEEGHTFYALNSPTANTTLVYDNQTALWHERQSFDDSGVLSRDRANFHAYAFGMHIMFDYANGNIYQSQLNVMSENGNMMPRIRIGPHNFEGLKYVFYKTFELDMNVGDGLDGTVQGSNPVATLRYSDDGGYTWSKARAVSIGTLGNRKTRARWRQLGKARDRVFWVEVDDPVPVVMIKAYSDFVEGNS